MIPLIPYNGIWRPVIMLAVTGLTFFVLYQARGNNRYKRLLFVACLCYIGLLIYATFLSRNVSQNYRYRLEFMGNAKQVSSINDNIWTLRQDDSVVVKIDGPERLETIAINILLTVPLGYLIPMLFAFYCRRIKALQVVLAGSTLSATIEIVQLITRLGMLDVDDWVFNTLGTAIGYCLYWRFLAKKNR